MFDLDAARAAAAEADDLGGFDFTLGEEKFCLPGLRDWPLQAQEMLGEGNITGAVALVMGIEDYQRLKASGCTVGDLKLLFDELGRTSGVGNLGNLPASAPPGSTQT